MKASPRYIAYGLLVVLLSSVVSSAFLNISLSYAADMPVTVTTEDIEYRANDEVLITGSVSDVDPDVDTVKITVTPPSGSSANFNEDLDNGEFFHTYKLPGGAIEGRWKVKVTYNGEVGYSFFKVKDSHTDDVSVETDDDVYSAGDRVDFSGTVDNLVTGEDSVDVSVIGPDDQEIDSFSIDLDGSDFGDRYDLDDHADPGRYTLEVTYDGNKGVAIFEVEDSSSGTGGSSGSSGSDSSSGDTSSTTTSFTARLDKSSFLAGDTITITGKVPKVVKDETVNVDVYKPDKTYAGASASVEPKSDLSFTAIIKLPATLKVSDESYEAKINYNGEEIIKSFTITGVSSNLPISVKTDKDRYSVGGEVTISGKVSQDILQDGVNIVLKVSNPSSAPYRIDIIEPKADGSYSYSLVIGGQLGIPGEYKVVASYSQKNAETTFDLASANSENSVFSLKDSGKSYSIEYAITNGVVKNMFIKPQDKRLVISIGAEADGKLTIVLPRKVIDSIEDGSDIEYAIFASDLDGGGDENVNVEEVKNDDQTRTLQIDYPAGTDVIEISGTSVVPEFGPFSAVILAIAIVAIILFSARYTNKLGGLASFKNAAS